MPSGQGQKMTLTFHTYLSSTSYLHLPTFRSQAAIVYEKCTVFTFSPIEKPKLSNLTLP